MGIAYENRVVNTKRQTSAGLSVNPSPLTVTRVPPEAGPLEGCK